MLLAQMKSEPEMRSVVLMLSPRNEVRADIWSNETFVQLCDQDHTLPVPRSPRLCHTAIYMGDRNTPLSRSDADHLI